MPIIKIKFELSNYLTHSDCSDDHKVSVGM